MNSKKKTAWDAVHAAYAHNGTPIVAGVPKRKYVPKKSPAVAPLRPMSFRGGAQKEDIPGREEEGPKEVKAKDKERLRAEYSLGQWAWRRFGGNEIKISRFRTTDSETAFNIPDVKERYTGYWPEWAPIMNKDVVYNGVKVRVHPNGYIYVFIDGKHTEEEAANMFEHAFGWSLMNSRDHYTVEEPKEVKAKVLEKPPAKSDNQAILADLEKVVAEATEASKEGGKFKKRENWKGKAAYMKKIDALWNKYSGGADAFYGKIPFESGISWKPKDQGGESHASRMQRLHGTNID